MRCDPVEGYLVADRILIMNHRLRIARRHVQKENVPHSGSKKYRIAENFTRSLLAQRSSRTTLWASTSECDPRARFAPDWRPTHEQTPQLKENPRKCSDLDDFIDRGFTDVQKPTDGPFGLANRLSNTISICLGLLRLLDTRLLISTARNVLVPVAG